jgi:hypothetical protein
MAALTFAEAITDCGVQSCNAGFVRVALSIDARNAAECSPITSANRCLT